MSKKNGEKNSTIENEKNKVKNTQISTQLYDKKIDAKHRVGNYCEKITFCKKITKKVIFFQKSDYFTF